MLGFRRGTAEVTPQIHARIEPTTPSEPAPKLNMPRGYLQWKDAAGGQSLFASARCSSEDSRIAFGKDSITESETHCECCGFGRNQALPAANRPMELELQSVAAGQIQRCTAPDRSHLI